MTSSPQLLQQILQAEYARSCQERTSELRASLASYRGDPLCPAFDMFTNLWDNHVHGISFDVDFYHGLEAIASCHPLPMGSSLLLETFYLLPNKREWINMYGFSHDGTAPPLLTKNLPRKRPNLEEFFKQLVAGKKRFTENDCRRAFAKIDQQYPDDPIVKVMFYVWMVGTVHHCWLEY
jgi:hypothetical protein